MRAQPDDAPRKARAAAWILIAGGALVMAAGTERLLRDPSFWLDEAYIALNVRTRPLSGLFAPLEFGQWFPRLYLASIHLLHSTLGYTTLVLRALPWLSFVLATGMMVLILGRLARGSRTLALLGVALLLPLDVWVLQAASLKQYTFDTLLALLPFIVSDRTHAALLAGRLGAPVMAVLLLPLSLSYTYLVPLLGRLGGVALAGGAALPSGAPVTGARGGVRRAGLLRLAVGMALAFGLLYLTDLRVNARAHVDAFWESCVLRGQLASPAGLLPPILKLLFAWHEDRMPLPVALGFALLLGLGIAAVLLSVAGGMGRIGRRILAIPGATRIVAPLRDGMGSAAPGHAALPIGSLLTLTGLVGASVVAGYPICRGRLTLFVVIHVLVLTLCGAIVVRGWLARRPARRGLGGAAAAAACLFALAAAAAIREERAPENLRPLLAHLAAAPPAPLFIHDCTISQWRALPEEPPRAGFLDGSPEENLARLRAVPGPVRVISTHLLEPCGGRLEQIRKAARTWEVVFERDGAALASATY